MKVPEKLSALRVYMNGEDLLGIADVTLPTIEYMSDTVTGAGVAGEVSAPAVGQFSSMTVSFNWRTVLKPLIQLLKPEAHQLDCRGAIQQYDAGIGSYKSVPLKVLMKATPKSGNLGKLATASSMDSATEFEVVYIKVAIDGEELLEVDKYNYIFRIEGVDYMSDTRSALGLE